MQAMDQMPEERQRYVLNFARSLAVAAPVGVAGKDLLRFAGILTDQEAQSLSQAKHLTRGLIMKLTDRIEMNPKIMLGKPIIRGTRMTVELILRKLSEGATEAELIAAHPSLSSDDIRAAIAYAAEMLAHEVGIFLEQAISEQAG